MHSRTLKYNKISFFWHKFKSYIYNKEIGKPDESLGRKATGPVKWQPVAKNEVHCLSDGAFLYNRKLHFLLYKKPPAGCALRRILKMSRATAAGARMCRGTFFFTELFHRRNNNDFIRKE